VPILDENFQTDPSPGFWWPLESRVICPSRDWSSACEVTDMTSEELKARTKLFAASIVKLVRTLPADPITREIGIQLVRSSGSVAANYRASCRSRSRAEFVAKLGIVEEEADESGLWLELLAEDGAVSRTQLAPYPDEAEQLVRIVVASIRTARTNTDRRP
jgi:four helix bundle protein